MKPVKFHPKAQSELLEAAEYYEEHQKDLGKRFLEFLQESINRIQINPLIYRTIDEDIRQCRVNKFPYGIIFRPKETHIEVIAVMHLHRKPNYWKDRLI